MAIWWAGSTSNWPKPMIERTQIVLTSMIESLVGPLRHVYGVSDKVVMMTLSSLLLASNKTIWSEVGASMIAIDTLVHNFLHRTGILHRLGANHPYGAACYRPNGCADIIRTIATRIDARRFNRTFPKVFPRFVQNAIWRYCAQSYFDVCNGNRIDDRQAVPKWPLPTALALRP